MTQELGQFSEHQCDGEDRWCGWCEAKQRVMGVAWANEEWSEAYRMGYDKALSRVYAALRVRPEKVEPHPFNAGFDGSCRDCAEFPGDGRHPRRPDTPEAEPSTRP